MRLSDVPTRVGMARPHIMTITRFGRCPHPRGDGPAGENFACGDVLMSPPAWGWPAVEKAKAEGQIDVPTRVGMARGDPQPYCVLRRCPHPRGDGPLLGISRTALHGMSPPAWGWPACLRCRALRVGDVPTRVGMARDF